VVDVLVPDRKDVRCFFEGVWLSVLKVLEWKGILPIVPLVDAVVPLGIGVAGYRRFTTPCRPPLGSKLAGLPVVRDSDGESGNSAPSSTVGSLPSFNGDCPSGGGGACCRVSRGERNGFLNVALARSTRRRLDDDPACPGV